MLSRLEREAKMANFEAAIQELQEKMAQMTAETMAKVNAAENPDSATVAADDGVQGILGCFFHGLEVLKHYSGYEQLRDSCIRCFENAWVQMEEGAEPTMSLMSAKNAVLVEINRYINFLKLCFAEDDIVIIEVFKKRGIIDAFFGNIFNLAGITVRTLRRLGAHLPKNKFFGAVLTGAKVIAHAILAGAKFVFDIVKNVISFVGGGIVIAITLIRNAISMLWTRIKSTAETVMDDDFMDDDFVNEMDENEEYYDNFDFHHLNK